jgi:hypothetical protein
LRERTWLSRNFYFQKIMNPQVLELLHASASLLAGGLIGVTFGVVQQAAARRYQQKENTGQFNTGWAVMPGSMRRVAALLVTLLLVQLICPLLFSNGCQWYVSAGLVAGYALMLFRQLRQRLANKH